MADSKPKWSAVAGPGQCFVCAACGKEAQSVRELHDTSCMMHAVLCHARTDGDRAARRATAVQEEGE